MGVDAIIAIIKKTNLVQWNGSFFENNKMIGITIWR